MEEGRERRIWGKRNKINKGEERRGGEKRRMRGGEEWEVREEEDA